MSADKPKFAAVTDAPQPTNTVLADKKLEVTYQIVKEQASYSNPFHLVDKGLEQKIPPAKRSPLRPLPG